MLKSLSIRNYALIEAIDADFPDGLNIITGETGAGKSILLGAISLLSGGKVESSALRSDRNCVVEGDFGEYILRRVISPAGRSRCFVNDEPVTAAELGEVASRLIDIHAQHRHLLLKERNFQLEVLDAFAGTSELLASCRAEFRKAASLRDRLSELESRINAAEAQREFNEFQFGKLADAALREGELEELENEQKILANAEDIKSAALGAFSILDSDTGSVIGRLREAASLLARQSGVAPDFDALGSRIESCRIECRDIADELERIGGDITVSPERLEKVEERMALLYSLMKRFNAPDIATLIGIRDELGRKLEDTSGLEEERGAVKAAIALSEKRLAELAGDLSAKRAEAAPGLASTLQLDIRALEMPAAVFKVEVTSDPLNITSSGADTVRFLFSANGGRELTELGKVASGGELSRIMLCLKKLLAENNPADRPGSPVMVFDEIDVGVSGSIADKMGQMIEEMGKKMQIIAITHLPQVASKGDSHILVYKGKGCDGTVRTDIRFLEGEERVMEIARLLSGEKTTSEAVANAKVLLEK